MMFDPANWTAVIPAAGKGTRLGTDIPKLFYPVLGKPLVLWMTELLRPFCGRLVVVVAPDAVPAARRLLPADVCLVEQASPRGMADAVWQARAAVTTPHVLVAWVDQITLQSQTVQSCLELHETHPGTRLTLPVVRRPAPYIELVWSKTGRLLAVRQAREGEVVSAEADSDCGLFLFDTAALFDVLKAGREEPQATGNQTGEFNLLPLLPRLNPVQVWRDTAIEESWGVNTVAEAAAVARWLEARR